MAQTPAPTSATVSPGKLRLVLATHDRKVLDVECDEVVVPASRGALGVLPGHTPLLAILQIGELFYRVGRREYYLALSRGFVEIGSDVVTLLADFAEQPEEIDLAAAEREAVAMNEALRTATADTLAEVSDRLRLALVRAQVAKRPRAAA